MLRTALMLGILILGLSCTKGNTDPNFKFMPPSGDGTAAKMGDIKITDADVTSGIEAELYEAEMKIYELKFNKIKSLILEKLVESDPRKKGMSNDEFLDKYISSSIKVTEKDIDAFIKEKNIPAEHINPQIRERIKAFIEMENKKKAVDNWLAEKTSKNPVEVYVAKPRRPTFDVKLGDAPTVGDKNAKVTIVEFSDFQCPFCAKGAEIIGELKKKYGKKIQIGFKNFPLPFHNQAKDAANAALCAKEQSVDAFWKMHDGMFADQSKLDMNGLKELGKKAGLKAQEFEKCLTENRYAGKVDAEMEEGKVLGVKSTPTFYVNGMLINGAQPIEVFSEIIDEQLKAN